MVLAPPVRVNSASDCACKAPRKKMKEKTGKKERKREKKSNVPVNQLYRKTKSEKTV